MNMILLSMNEKDILQSKRIGKPEPRHNDKEYVLLLYKINVLPMEAGYGHFVCSFWRLMKGDKTKKNAKMKFHFFVLSTCITRQNEQTTKRNGRKNSFCRVVVLSFWRLVEFDKTNIRQNKEVTTTNQTLIFRGNFVVLSFCRALEKATKRRNEEMKFHSFALATCTTRQNEQTKKWNFVFAFSRLFVLVPWPTRQNEDRRNEIPFLRFGDLYNATKRTNEEMIFCFCVLVFVRFGALTNATKRRNEEMKFHFFVLATCATRQNEQTKKWIFVFAFSRLFM